MHEDESFVEDVSAWEDYIFHVPESLDFSWHWHHSWLFLQSSENVGNAFSMIYCINTSFFINNKLFWSRLDTYLMVGREVIVSSTFAFTKIVTDAFRIGIRDFGCGDFSSYRTRWHWLIFQRRNHRRRHQGLLEDFYANGRFSTFVFEMIRKAFKVLTPEWRNWEVSRIPDSLRILAESTFPFSCFANDKSIAIMKIRNPDSGTRSHGIIRHVTI